MVILEQLPTSFLPPAVGRANAAGAPLNTALVLTRDQLLELQDVLAEAAFELEQRGNQDIAKRAAALLASVQICRSEQKAAPNPL